MTRQSKNRIRQVNGVGDVAKKPRRSARATAKPKLSAKEKQAKALEDKVRKLFTDKFHTFVIRIAAEIAAGEGITEAEINSIEELAEQFKTQLVTIPSMQVTREGAHKIAEEVDGSCLDDTTKEAIQTALAKLQISFVRSKDDDDEDDDDDDGDDEDDDDDE